MREGKPSGLAMHQRLLRERLVRCWQNGSWSLSRHSPPCCLYLELFFICICICVFVLFCIIILELECFSLSSSYLLFIFVFEIDPLMGATNHCFHLLFHLCRGILLLFCLIVSVQNSIIEYSLSVKCFGFHCTCILSLCFDRSIAVHSPVQSVGGGRAQSSVPSKSSL